MQLDVLAHRVHRGTAHRIPCHLLDSQIIVEVVQSLVCQAEQVRGVRGVAVLTCLEMLGHAGVASETKGLSWCASR